MLRRTRYIWNQVPLLRFSLPLIIGIVIGIGFPNLNVAWAMLALALVCCFSLILASDKGALKLLLLCVSAYGLGYVLTVAHTDRLYTNHLSHIPFGFQEHTFQGSIASDPIAREKTVKFKLKLNAIKQDSLWQPVIGTVLLYIQLDTSSKQLALGDVLLVSARLNAIDGPKNPAQFDYKRYLSLHQIHHQSYVPQESWVLVEKGSGLMREIKSWQHAIIETIASYGINDRELAIVSALLVGYKHHLSRDQVDAFARAGAMHVLAVSGLHVGIIYMIVGYLLRFFNRWKWGGFVRALILLSTLWFYALLTGLSPSVTRASTMFSFVIVAALADRRSDIYNTIVASAVFLLIINPFIIAEVGFQLSYIAVLGIVWLQPKIYELWQPKWWIIDRMWALSAVSVAAQLATFPLALLYFHQFPNYFLLSNLIVVPMASIILPVGMLLVLVSTIPFVAEVTGKLLYHLVRFLDGFIQWTEGLPYAVLNGIDIGVVEMTLIYAVIVFGTLFLMRKRFNELALTLALFCILEAWNVAEAFHQQHQKLMVFYNLRDGDAIDLIDGRSHTFIADSNVLATEQSIGFNIQPHWVQRDLQQPKFETFKEPVINWNDHVILVIDNETQIDSIGQIDILFIAARTIQHPQVVLELVKPEWVVLSTNLDWKTANYWDDILNTQKRQFRNLKEDAALAIEL